MKIASWNVNSIAIRLEQIFEWLRTTETDVLCLQETKTVDEKFPLEAINNFGYHAAFMGQKSYNGVAILSKHELQDVQKNFADDTEDSPKRLIAATIKSVRIVNTYIPNGTELWTDKFTFKLDWLQRLRRMFDENFDKSGDVLLCGDFNVAPDERDVWNVKDVFRLKNGDAVEFSWWNYRESAFPKNQGLRIDHVWTSKSLAEKCVGCWIDRTPRGWERPSDHTPVVAEFKL